MLVTGCASITSQPKAPATSTAADSASETRQAAAAQPLARLRDGNGFLLQVDTAVKDPGGVLTVSGTLTNASPKSRVVTAFLRGDETEILVHGLSLGGATLTDARGKKRYYVLRDTDGRPLTTTGLSILDAGQTVPIYMQFPAPPATTTQVTLQLPTFSSATIALSQ
ncbi:hypothetical protein U5640_11530 [Streptomyces sp. SS7]|uniref:hypothetical protein n=1 Tax=Streptomyces sp. SS7 TaxID=3108485 RepID=UPI0030EF2CE8